MLIICIDWLCTKQMSKLSKYFYFSFTYAKIPPTLQVGLGEYVFKILRARFYGLVVWIGPAFLFLTFFKSLSVFLFFDMWSAKFQLYFYFSKQFLGMSLKCWKITSIPYKNL